LFRAAPQKGYRCNRGWFWGGGALWESVLFVSTFTVDKFAIEMGTV